MLKWKWHRPHEACNIDKRVKTILAIKVTQSERERKIAACDLPVLCWGGASSWCTCSKWDTNALVMVPWENWLQHKNSFSWDKGVNLPTWAKKLKLNLNTTTLVFTWSTNSFCFSLLMSVYGVMYPKSHCLASETRLETIQQMLLSWGSHLLCFWHWR